MNNPPGASSQIPLPLNLGDKANFDNFWVGHNSELVTAIKACIQLGNPRLIYFYGPPSSGKSHLLFAAMRLAGEEVISTSYLSLGDINVNPQMLELVDAAHLVCIDNLEYWAADKELERALFALFERVKHAGGQLLISARQPPDQCGFKLADLNSRLLSGLVYSLRELTEDQQFEAIKMRANNRGLSITDDTVRYLLRRSSRDTGELFAILDKIDRASLIEKRRITIPFLQKLIK
ncbi:MAG: DnaA regulatory inactivator Hda [Gammaproteobacteria bacterium]|nr:DnaA regulatory inactivator Hda [Gammaproteobacteria bacterium]